MGIKLHKKTVSLDTFLVKAISKAFPLATHINLQNAITEAYPVFYCCDSSTITAWRRVSISYRGHSHSR